MDIKTIHDTWPIASFMIGCLVALGGMIFVIKRLVADVKEIKNVLYSPDKPENRLLTAGECERCNLRCKSDTHALIDVLTQNMKTITAELSREVKQTVDILCEIRIGMGVILDRNKQLRKTDL